MSNNKEFLPKETDESLDTLLENMKITQTEDLDELIEKRVNRRIRHIVLQVLAVILIPLILVRMVLSPIMNAVNINPYQMNADREVDENGSIISDSTLYRSLDAWIETQFPYSELDYVSVEKLGYGRYTINAHVLDLKQPVSIGGSANVSFIMKTGRLSMSQNLSNINQFRNDFADGIEIDGKKEDISAFPDSSWIFAAVSLQSPTDIGTLLEMENDDLSIDWAQVYAEGIEPVFGINLNHVISNDPEGIRKHMSSKDLKQLFLTRMELLKSEENIFTQQLGISSATSDGAVIYSPQASVDMITQMMEVIGKTEGFAAQNFYVSGTKEAILQLMDDMEPKGIQVIDARLYRG